MDIKGDSVDGYPELKPDSMTRKGLDVTSEHVSENLTVAEEQEKVAAEIQATADQAFAAKLSRRSPPNDVERAEIERAKKRTKARAPRIAMHVEKRGAKAGRTYPGHSDEEGHRFRLADAFGTRSMEFVDAMLKGVGMATGKDRAEQAALAATSAPLIQRSVERATGEGRRSGPLGVLGPAAAGPAARTAPSALAFKLMPAHCQFAPPTHARHRGQHHGRP